MTPLTPLILRLKIAGRSSWPCIECVLEAPREARDGKKRRAAWPGKNATAATAVRRAERSSRTSGLQGRDTQPIFAKGAPGNRSASDKKQSPSTASAHFQVLKSVTAEQADTGKVCPQQAREGSSGSAGCLKVTKYILPSGPKKTFRPILKKQSRRKKNDNGCSGTQPRFTPQRRTGRDPRTPCGKGHQMARLFRIHKKTR